MTEDIIFSLFFLIATVSSITAAAITRKKFLTLIPIGASIFVSYYFFYDSSSFRMIRTFTPFLIFIGTMTVICAISAITIHVTAKKNSCICNDNAESVDVNAVANEEV